MEKGVVLIVEYFMEVLYLSFAAFLCLFGITTILVFSKCGLTVLEIAMLLILRDWYVCNGVLSVI